VEAAASPYEQPVPATVAAVGDELDPERIIHTQFARARSHL
jgi:hypothetical protein